MSKETKAQKGEQAMSDYANDRADKHVEMMQEQRKSITDFMIREEEMAEIDSMIREGMQKIHDEPIKTKAIAEQYQSNTKQAVWTVLGLTLVAIIVVYLSWGGL